MSIVEASISVPAEHETNVFGQFDQHIKKDGAGTEYHRCEP